MAKWAKARDHIAVNMDTAEHIEVASDGSVLVVYPGNVRIVISPENAPAVLEAMTRAGVELSPRPKIKRQ